MIHTLLRMGDPRLLQRAREVESFGAPELYALVADMFETMAQAGGVGLAAPQIGVDLRVIVLGMEHRVGRGEKPDGVLGVKTAGNPLGYRG